MSLFHRKKEKFEYNIDVNSANEMLQNVFEAVGQTPNTIPFDKLLLRQKAKTGSLIAARSACTAALILTLFMPLAFVYGAFDTKNPIIINNYKENELLWIELEDDITGIDYSHIYATTEDGAELLPFSIDRNKGLISFETNEKSLNIFISDYAGNTTHAIYQAED